MWHLRNGILFICIWCIGRVSAVDEFRCDYNYKNFAFTQNKVGHRPAENLYVDLATDSPVLTVYIWKIYENFNLTLFAIPLHDNETHCPPTLIGDEDLRQYRTTCPVSKNETGVEQIYFDQIFTGCYYFIATNAEGNNWEWGPNFYKTKYLYLDTKLELITHHVKPADRYSTMNVEAEIKIPLSCIIVRAQIFELNGTVNAIDHVKNGKIPAMQECWFLKNDKNMNTSCKRTKFTTNIVPEVSLGFENGEEWELVIEWKGLKYDIGGTYYLWFSPDNKICEENYNESVINTWRRVNKNDYIKLDYPNATNWPESIGPTSGLNDLVIILSIFGISMSLTLMTILVYCIWKHLGNIKGDRAPSEMSDNLQENALLYEKIQSNDILLIYARSTPAFMEVMSSFRDHLQQKCYCHVYDLYAKNDLHMIMKLGAIGWVEELFRNGCKVVLVDTPEFRSLLNGHQDPHVAPDFRNAVIPYAVDLAKGVFEDSRSQYLRYFVVRITALEVDDRHGDPLRLITPHARYHFPTHLPELFEHLKDPAKCLEKTST